MSTEPVTCYPFNDTFELNQNPFMFSKTFFNDNSMTL